MITNDVDLFDLLRKSSLAYRRARSQGRAGIYLSQAPDLKPADVLAVDGRPFTTPARISASQESR